MISWELYGVAKTEATSRWSEQHEAGEWVQCADFFATIGEPMTRLFPAGTLLALIFFILLVHAAALYRDLYFHFWWLDIPVHILGGLWIALFGLTRYYATPHIEEKNYSRSFVVVFAVALTLCIGLFWEIYEFGVQHAIGDFGIGLADTLLDLVDDLIGALIGALIFIRGGYYRKT